MKNAAASDRTQCEKAVEKITSRLAAKGWRQDGTVWHGPGGHQIAEKKIEELIALWGSAAADSIADTITGP